MAVEDGKVWGTHFRDLLVFAKTDVPLVYCNRKANGRPTKVLYQREDSEDTSWDKRIGRVLPGAVLSQEPMTWYVDKDAYNDVHLDGCSIK